MRPKQPFFFLKPSSSILLPQQGPVRRPHGTELHYEVELALIVGKELRDLDENDEVRAMDAIECIYHNLSTHCTVPSYLASFSETSYQSRKYKVTSPSLRCRN